MTSLPNAKTPEEFGAEDEILLADYAQIATVIAIAIVLILTILLILTINLKMTMLTQRQRFCFAP
jgi:hypothetical protein